MEFDKMCIAILRCLYKEGILELKQLKVITHFRSDDIMDRLVYLWKNEYVRVAANEQPKYLAPDYRFQITTKGKIYLDNRKKNALHKWYPYVISTVALIVSALVALFK